MSRLRPFQVSIQQGVFHHWNAGVRNVGVRSPTGSGKTVVVADTIRQMNRGTASIAHRKELVSQMSLALAREGVRHGIVGGKATRKDCVELHMDRLKRSWIDDTARVRVCSVDTLVDLPPTDPWAQQVALWVTDEAHHLLQANKWGKAVGIFTNPHILGLAVSATWERADGKGLGRTWNAEEQKYEGDGLVDELVQGPQMRAIINSGFLTDYRVFTPPSNVDYSSVSVTASGDYSPAKLSAAVHADDTFVGDTVQQYLRIAPGKLGVTFATDVQHAKELATAFRGKGVTAEVVTGTTDPLVRNAILRRFERREIMMLVNVDLFGEGFDLPAIEVVIMARKTESWSLYVQQFGRALRLLISSELSDIWGQLTDDQRLWYILHSEKPFGIIIDHVGNVLRHGLPDADHVEGLERRAARAGVPTDAIPLRRCLNPNGPLGQGVMCAHAYRAYLKQCPHCQFVPEVAQRSAPEFVDGDLWELSAEALQALRGRRAENDAPPTIWSGMSPGQAGGLIARHREKVEQQQQLRDAMAWWRSWQQTAGLDDSQSYRKFHHTFGIDVMNAQCLNRADAEKLTTRIQSVISRYQEGILI